MTERAIILLRDNEATEQLLELSAQWDTQCKKLGQTYEDVSLAKSARIAGALIVQQLDMWPPKVVSVELDAEVAGQLAMDLRMRLHDGIMAAFWFSMQLQENTAFMVLTCNRIKDVLNGINSAERYSMLHAKAAKRRSKRDSILGTLDLSLQRAAAVQERDIVTSQVRKEVEAAMI